MRYLLDAALIASFIPLLGIVSTHKHVHLLTRVYGTHTQKNMVSFFHLIVIETGIANSIAANVC